MSKRLKKVFIVVISVMALLVITFILRPDLITFFMLQADSIQHAGTWEDDPKNWSRAFNEEHPGAVKVVHSKYWRSDHFTYEYVYFFEVEATPEWRDALLRKRNLELVSPSAARSFRTNNQSEITPNWFAPDPVGNYDVWDKAGYFGSVWINKSNGHIYFYDMQV